VRFEGFAFDQGFRPIPDVAGSVRLVNVDTNEDYEADLLDQGEGKHTAEFRQLPPGTYSYRAGFEKGGQVLKWSEGRLLVESFSLEEVDQRGNEATLQAVARVTGGQYFPYREFEAAIQAIDTDPVRETVKGEFSLWGRAWLLLIFVCALGLEWVLRKINYLI
jgi:hypothetical protein